MANKKRFLKLGDQVRKLRLQRHWTQKRLALTLAITQGQLSKLERGDGEFTASQLVTLLKRFNVTLDDLSSTVATADAQLQNALARQGAVHLAEMPDLLPSEKLRTAGIAVREALVSADSARQVAAIAPVFVVHAGQINLARLRNEFAELGLENRFCWAIESTLAAIRTELPRVQAREWRVKYQRAITIIESSFSAFLDRAPQHTSGPSAAFEVLDPEITTRETLDEIVRGVSPIAKKWRIATMITDEDFARALRAARGSG